MAENKEDKTIAVLSYLGILFLVPLLVERKNKFAQYHAKQGLALFLAEVATMVVGWVPFIGWLIAFVAWIPWVILSVMGIINVINRREKPLPIIGKFALNIFGE